MKDLLLKKKTELETQMKSLQTEINRLQEQYIMTNGAMQYNELLLKELADKEEQVKE